MNPDHMDNIELLNFCDEGTDGQKKSYDTARYSDISLRKAKR